MAQANPAHWGMTAKGWYTPTYTEIRADLVERFQDNLPDGKTLPDLSPTSTFGKIISVQALARKRDWDSRAEGVLSINPDRARGVRLDDVAALNLKRRKPSGYASVLLLVQGSSGVTIPAGAVVTNPENTVRFVIPTSVTLSGVGTQIEVLAYAEQPGDLPDDSVTASDLTRIDNPIPGWVQSAQNPTPVTSNSSINPGDERESDAQLRRRVRQRIGIGRGTPPAIRAGMQSLTGVADVIVIDNRSSYTRDGLPPHGVRVILTPDTLDDGRVAQQLYDYAGAGANLVGAQSDDIATEDGAVTIYWDWAGEASLFMEAELVGETDGQGNQVTPPSLDDVGPARETILEYVQSLGIGQVINRTRLNCAIIDATETVEDVKYYMSVGDPVSVPGDLWDSSNSYGLTGSGYELAQHDRFVITNLDNLEVARSS